MTEEKEKELRAWWPNRQKPPWPLESRFLTMEEYWFVDGIRKEELEKAIKERNARLYGDQGIKEELNKET